MVSRLSLFIAAMAALIGVVSLNATGAWALTMQECSAKYKAAQTAGTLNGKTWNQFRKDECGATAAAPARPLRKKPRLQRRQPRATRYFQPQSRLPTPRSRLGRRACTLVSTSTRPIRRATATAGSSGSRRVAATTVNATGD